MYIDIFFSREQNERTKRFCSNTKMLGQTTVSHEADDYDDPYGVHDGISKSLFCRRCVVVVADRFLIGVRCFWMPTCIPTLQLSVYTLPKNRRLKSPFFFKLPSKTLNTKRPLFLFFLFFFVWGKKRTHFKNTPFFFVFFFNSSSSILLRQTCWSSSGDERRRRRRRR